MSPRSPCARRPRRRPRRGVHLPPARGTARVGRGDGDADAGVGDGVAQRADADERALHRRRLVSRAAHSCSPVIIIYQQQRGAKRSLWLRGMSCAS